MSTVPPEAVQVTAVLVLPDTVATNCSWPPVYRLKVVGLMAMPTSRTLPVSEGPEVILDPPPQAKRRGKANKAKNCRSRGHMGSPKKESE